MSITKQTLNAHLNDPAVFCCQRKKGAVIGHEDLEDPNLFEDMVDAGLLQLSDNGLSIKQVLGQTLIKDCEALTQITKEFVDSVASHDVKEDLQQKSQQVSAVQTSKNDGGRGMIRINVDKLEGLTLEIPEGTSVASALAGATSRDEQNTQTKVVEKREEKTIRTLVKKEYKVDKVELGSQTTFEKGVLTVDKGLVEKAYANNPLVKELKMDVITPENRHVYTNTIMDVMPVSAKVEGKIGEGTTNTLKGVVFCLTGLDEDGVQIHEFGQSSGYLDEKIAFGRPGSPDEDDIIIRVDAVVQKGTGMERRGPLAAHTACDVIIQDIRETLKKTTEPVINQETCHDVHKTGRPRVVLIKEIMGQGAMHDNILVPSEPAGVLGGQKNVDLGNVPVMLSPNEVRDGGIHALTCIGPATKETTRHYFREPLVEELAKDDEVNLVGVLLVGSPQVNDEKMYVSERLGMWVETMDLDGAIITTEGFGNNHIDFASHISQVGSRGVPVVGVTFSAYQGQLVVGNKYMDAMVELNKDKEGFENEILACSSICKEDAKRAAVMLKTKMAGVPIEQPNRKWNQETIDANQRLV